MLVKRDELEIKNEITFPVKMQTFFPRFAYQPYCNTVTQITVISGLGVTWSFIKS